MQSNMITLSHHMDDYECMWNGIEDLYIQQTGQPLPPKFFFVLAGFGSFCYRKTEKDDLKRLIALGDGRTKNMYQFLAPIVGFEYHHYEYRTFDQALSKAKAEVDSGHPPVLGALDMYYLPYYPKLYRGDHIPFHYVLMVGYNDEAQQVYLHDCGREAIQTLSYDDLRAAWNCEYPGLSKPNTVCTIRMKATKDKFQIAKEALAKKSEHYLHPQANFIGEKGFQKFIDELPKLRQTLSKEEYDKILVHMITFFGTVPNVPNALRGINEPDVIGYGGGFDKMSRVLVELGTELNDKVWLTAASRFQEGAAVISDITYTVVRYLTGEEDGLHFLPELFCKTKEILSEGFLMLDR